MQRPKKPLPPLNALRAFEATARLASLTKAAQELHVTQGAVSQQVKLLEEYLGASLFTRKSRKMHLTDLARSYLPVVSEAFSKVQISTQELFDTTHQPFIQIRCGTSFAQRWLVPRLADFATKHPQYRLRLQTIIWHDSEAIDGVDLEICHGYSNYSGSVQRIIKEHWMVVTSAQFAQKLGNNPSLMQLMTQPLISTMGYLESWNTWFEAQGIEDARVMSNFEADNTTMALDMTLNGMGIMFGLNTHLDEHIESGALVQIHPFELEAQCGIYLVLPLQDIRPKTKDFCLWLFSQLADHPNRDDLDWQHD